MLRRFKALNLEFQVSRSFYFFAGGKLMYIYLHFDVYRIGDIEEMDEIGYEDYVYGEGVCLIEWANLIEEILPDHYQKITIRKDLEKGFDYREIEMEEQ